MPKPAFPLVWGINPCPVLDCLPYIDLTDFELIREGAEADAGAEAWEYIDSESSESYPFALALTSAKARRELRLVALDDLRDGGCWRVYRFCTLSRSLMSFC